MHMEYILGFDIGGTKSAVLLARPGADRVEFLDRHAIPTRGSWQEVLDSLACHGKQMLEAHGAASHACSIGISCGGPLDSRSGTILSPPNLPGWDKVPVTDYLGKKLGMAARLKNDADACALAEWKYGAGRGCSHMVFLTFGTGLGAGLILDGRLYEGACGMAGEAGHIRLAPEGPVGYGKAGSFEGFCSGGGIAQLARYSAEEALREGRSVSYMGKGGPDSITARDVAAAAGEGHEDALRIFAVSGRYFGRGLSILIDILNPERIIAGSIFTRAGHLMREEMEKALRREALPASLSACTILPSSLGEQIGDYGAVSAAMGNELSNTL